jgi:hypothetical protein
MMCSIPRRALSAIVLCLFCAGAAMADKRTVPPLPADAWRRADLDVEEWLERCRRRYKKIEGYRCIFWRRHVIDGEMTEWSAARMRFKKPFAVRLTFTSGPKDGTDVLYVKGKNEGELRARAGGLLGVVAVDLKPTSKRAMKGERHPITEVGIKQILDRMQRQMKGLADDEDLKLEYASYTAEVNETRYVRFIVRLPDLPEKDFYCDRAVIVVNADLELPVHVKAYEPANRLREQYIYRDLEVNPDFPPETFDFDDI